MDAAERGETCAFGIAPPPAKKRHKRRKAHLAWELADRDSSGLRARSLELLATKFPKLTTMELHVCVLVKERVPSWRIAEILGIGLRTVEGHRMIARKIMKIPHGKQLTTFLAKL